MNFVIAKLVKVPVTENFVKYFKQEKPSTSARLGGAIFFDTESVIKVKVAAET